MATVAFRLLVAAAIAVTAAPHEGAGQRLDPSDQGPVPLPFVARTLDPLLSELATVQAFERRVSDYVMLHRLLEGPLPPLEVSTDMRKVRTAMDALASRIHAARRGAHQGDVFTPDIAALFRRRIATSLTPEDIEAVLSDREEGDPIVAPRLSVNDRWPERAPFNFVPPQLLAALPPLPVELQYRIIGRSLVLWDHHADLIVDFLPGAFTVTT
jgi:hypothetical protein